MKEAALGFMLLLLLLLLVVLISSFSGSFFVMRGCFCACRSQGEYQHKKRTRETEREGVGWCGKISKKIRISFVSLYLECV